jgi:hypothetical protein
MLAGGAKTVLEPLHFSIPMMNAIRASVVLALVVIPALGSADDQPDGGHHWPRAEAIAACKDKSEGDTCSFEGHHGTVSGTCRKVPSGDLACAHPHHDHQGSSEK